MKRLFGLVVGLSLLSSGTGCCCCPWLFGGMCGAPMCSPCCPPAYPACPTCPGGACPPGGDPFGAPVIPQGYISPYSAAVMPAVPTTAFVSPLSNAPYTPMPAMNETLPTY